MLIHTIPHPQHYPPVSERGGSQAPGHRSQSRKEPGKSSSDLPGSFLSELHQSVSLNKGCNCCGREALWLGSRASSCNGMQNGNQNTGSD